MRKECVKYRNIANILEESFSATDSSSGASCDSQPSAQPEQIIGNHCCS